MLDQIMCAHACKIQKQAKKHGSSGKTPHASRATSQRPQRHSHHARVRSTERASLGRPDRSLSYHVRACMKMTTIRGKTWIVAETHSKQSGCAQGSGLVAHLWHTCGRQAEKTFYRYYRRFTCRILDPIHSTLPFTNLLGS